MVLELLTKSTIPVSPDTWRGCVNGSWHTITFGRGGQAVASRCSCSEVWLQERRSEQQAVRPSLFIREEMMLQPQPHIDLLISSLAVLECGEKRLAVSRSHFLVLSESPQLSSKLMPLLYCVPHGTNPQVLPPEIRLVLVKIQMLRLTLIHSEGTWVGKYSLSVHFPCDCFPLTPLPLLYFYLWTTRLLL